MCATWRPSAGAPADRARWRTGVATILAGEDPRAHLHHLSKLDAAAVSAMGTDLLMIRVDLDP